MATNIGHHFVLLLVMVTNKIDADDLNFAFYCLKHVNLDYHESSCNDDADDIADEEGEDEEDENDDEAHLAILR